MSVSLPDRNKSKTEFDNTYFKVHDDAVKIVSNNFGASKEAKVEHGNYIRVMGERVMKVVSDIGTHIRIANSIYPEYWSELEERRIQQEKAIGLCYDLLTKYQLIMHTLKVADDKYVQETKHIAHEINCLKKWRTSDNKRFTDLR